MRVILNFNQTFNDPIMSSDFLDSLTEKTANHITKANYNLFKGGKTQPIKMGCVLSMKSAAGRFAARLLKFNIRVVL